MDTDADKSTRTRTDAKLRYAALHFEELRQTHIGGSDFDQAHQEAFLFQLLGAIDAFLQEINVHYQCGLSLKEVRRHKLRNNLKERDLTSPELDKILRLEESDWLGVAKEMRDYSTHRKNVPRVYTLGGEHDGKTFLRNPKTGEKLAPGLMDLLQEWYSKTDQLIDQLRSQMTTQQAQASDSTK